MGDLPPEMILDKSYNLCSYIWITLCHNLTFLEAPVLQERVNQTRWGFKVSSTEVHTLDRKRLFPSDFEQTGLKLGLRASFLIASCLTDCQADLFFSLNFHFQDWSQNVGSFFSSATNMCSQQQNPQVGT